MISVLMPLAGDPGQMDISMTLPRGFPDNDNNKMMIHNLHDNDNAVDSDDTDAYIYNF